MSLVEEIEKARTRIVTDDYPMSIGELTNIFREKELKITPNYQRLFRWSAAQKSALFESLLIGVPIPPIFVFELDDGTWELIDGLQRTSTIMEFQGLLVGPEGDKKPPSVLSSTEYLPSLDGAVWDSSLSAEFGDEQDIGSELRISIKRAKIGIQILKKGSEERSKYDLFQRLNGNGSELSPQEFRTCVMVMLDENKYHLCGAVSDHPNFVSMLRLSPNKIGKQENLDFVCRFLAHYSSDMPKKFDVDEFITHQVKEIFVSEEDIESLLDICKSASDFICREVGSDALKRYDSGTFSGRVGKVGFECVFMGVAMNLDAISGLKDPKKFLIERIESFWRSDLVKEVLGASMNGNTRISKTVPFGRDFFKPRSVSSRG